MKDNCIFCKIGNGEIKEEILYEDNKVFVVRDINPRTPLHFLFIAKNHHEDLDVLLEKNPV